MVVWAKQSPWAGGSHVLRRTLGGWVASFSEQPHTDVPHTDIGWPPTTQFSHLETDVLPCLHMSVLAKS